ncbi:hypothetical protein X975_06217, partial [Stegodyphus mimosarum]
MLAAIGYLFLVWENLSKLSSMVAELHFSMFVEQNIRKYYSLN